MVIKSMHMFRVFLAFKGCAENNSNYAENSSQYAENSSQYAENSSQYAENSSQYAENSSQYAEKRLNYTVYTYHIYHPPYFRYILHTPLLRSKHAMQPPENISF